MRDKFEYLTGRAEEEMKLADAATVSAIRDVHARSAKRYLSLANRYWSLSPFH